jgi:hypothetical protein
MKILPYFAVVVVAILSLFIGIEAIFKPNSKGDNRLRICFSVSAFLSQIPRLLHPLLNYLHVDNHYLYLFKQLEQLMLGVALGIGILGVVLGGWKYKLMKVPPK